jgi:uncharacterized cupin superfamily protein
MPKVDLNSVPRSHGSGYPEPFHEPCKDRFTERLSQATLLTQFGVNLVTLRPGAWSSQRHWHEKEDEFVYVLSGELVLVEDDGETLLRAGDAAAWKAGVRNGHHLQNRGRVDAQFIAIGSRDNDDFGEYSDIDLRFEPRRYTDGAVYTSRAGVPYPKRT